MIDTINAKLDATPPHVPPQCVIDWDFNAVPGAENDVHEAWRQLQDGPDLRWTPYYGGHWIVTRAAVIKEVQSDYAHFSHREFSLPRGPKPPMPPIDLDPPEHTDLRRILSIAFAPRVINGLKAEIRELAIGLTENLVARGECEFVSDYSRQFPVTVFLRLADLPLSRRPEFLEWAELIVRGKHEEKLPAYGKVMHFIREVVVERYANPGTDVISQLLTSKVGDRRVTFEEGMGMSTLLFLGGLDTVASMLSFVARFLATHPDHRRQLIDNPALIPRAVEEFLRRYGLSNTTRLITEDYDFHGFPLKKGELIMVPISLSGMDERQWTNALEVDFNRDTRSMDTFGNGPHRCPGANLARTEIAVFIEEWLKRIPDFSIKEGGKVITATGSVNGVINLPLSWATSG